MIVLNITNKHGWHSWFCNYTVPATNGHSLLRGAGGDTAQLPATLITGMTPKDHAKLIVLLFLVLSVDEIGSDGNKPIVMCPCLDAVPLFI